MDAVLIKEVLLVFIWHLPSILLMGVVLVTKRVVNSNQIRYCITTDLTVKVVLSVVHHWSALVLKGVCHTGNGARNRRLLVYNVTIIIWFEKTLQLYNVLDH